MEESEKIMSTDNTITKTIWQYSEVLPEDTMEFLRGIASDYCKVKNEVYKRYSGVKNLDRLTPVYNILNEMRYCGLRNQLNLPTVYYELAITDAVTDIKCRWGIIKNKIRDLINVNKNLSAEDRFYLRTVIKLNSVYAAILNHQKYEMPQNAKELDIDVNRLNNLIRRLTRKYLTTPQTDVKSFFKISPNGYSYKDGTIRIVCRIPRKRVSIPLRDNRIFDRQIQVHIKENYVMLAVPVETKIKKHDEYIHTVYIHIGYKDMFTLSNGNIYGAKLEALVGPETERLARKNKERYRMYVSYKQNTEYGNLKKADKIEKNNLGKFKYDRQKEKEWLKTVTFINSEINRMLKIEKPNKVVVTKPIIKNKTKCYSKSMNRKMSRTFRSYIRERLAYKCMVNSIEFIEINSNGTGNICSSCGAKGERQGTEFICKNCGMQTTVSLNSAKNIQLKYLNG